MENISYTTTIRIDYNIKKISAITIKLLKHIEKTQQRKNVDDVISELLNINNTLYTLKHKKSVMAFMKNDIREYLLNNNHTNNLKLFDKLNVNHRLLPW